MRGLGSLDDAGWQALVREIVNDVRVTAERKLEIRGSLDRGDRYRANGSGRSWNFTTLLVVPFPPSW